MRSLGLKTLAGASAALAIAAPVASGAQSIPIAGRWQSLVNCAFTSYDPLTGRMSCVGSTLWTGGLSGITHYTPVTD
jgi:hypothetical protein